MASNCEKLCNTFTRAVCNTYQGWKAISYNATNSERAVIATASICAVASIAVSPYLMAAAFGATLWWFHDTGAAVSKARKEAELEQAKKDYENDEDAPPPPPLSPRT